jgi:hypothetical protein
MSSLLIQIKYGLDSNGNILTLSVNPKNVGSYRSELNRFYIFLNGIDYSSNPLPSCRNFQTKLEFLAPTGSIGATGAGNFMEGLWNNAVYGSDLISTIDFQSPGFLFYQTILST